MTYKEFASQINIKVDNPPNDCDMSREITIEDCIYLFNSLGRQIRHLQERSNWHTGTPTEDGYYLCHVQFNSEDYESDEEGYDLPYWFKDGSWGDESVRVIAWWKIEPYKEKEDGR